MSDSDDSVKTTRTASEDNVTRRRGKKMRPSPDAVKQRSYEPLTSCKRKIKVPPFSADDPEIWFALLESQFNSYEITDDYAMFDEVLRNLDIQHAKAVKDIVVNPPATKRYPKLKAQLIRRLCASREKKVKQLLTHEELGDRRPSQFLRHLQDLAGPSVPDDFIKSVWCTRLPQSIQTIVASQSHQTLEQLSELADRIQEVTSPCVAAASPNIGPSPSTSSEIAELRKMVEHLALKLDGHTRYPRSRQQRERSRSRSRERQRSRSHSSYRRHPVCWYHFKFGARARHCEEPCDYEKTGNAAGIR
ncbi:uncharacterized protein LOC115442156 [Manduca sexta]|uniref:uncharacterized protein LOC115442156 n=1 Tax=Manduca sexta TaxID=7130 RepID=UPI001184005B|nr:uncharacterized protein LOC115442156 [Manduca sexta]